jgi:hypothetical protein
MMDTIDKRSQEIKRISHDALRKRIKKQKFFCLFADNHYRQICSFYEYCEPIVIKKIIMPLGRGDAK